MIEPVVNEHPIRHFCTYPARGGAGIAADRLVRGLIAAGLPAELIGMNPHMEASHIHGISYRRDPVATIWRRFRDFQLRRVKSGYEGISPAGPVFFSDRSPNGVPMSEWFPGSGILHFHWVCDLIDYQDSLKRVPDGTPLVWTLHDMGAFTGGCSYSLDCRRYFSSCGECPHLETPKAKRETRLSHARKVSAVNRVRSRLALICPSRWMAQSAMESSIFKGVRCEVIPNGFDLEVFNPGHRDKGRRLLGFDSSEVVILFVAASFDNPLKGMHTLLQSLRDLAESGNPVRICYVGEKGEGHFPADWNWLGKVDDEEQLASLYAGSDVLVVPSEADNYPNVICEALASGVPVVASDIGGIPELVIDGKTGHLFRKGDARALRMQLDALVSRLPADRSAWSASCRRFAEQTFELGAITRRHMSLYDELIHVHST